MIYFLVTRKKQYTLDPFFNEWSPDIKSTASIINYEDMVKLKTYPPGIYIFTDIDALSVPMFNFASSIADILVNAYGKNAVLNRPSGVKKRRELLTLLAENGTNSFSVYSLDANFDKIRFPAFVRKADGHTGSLTGIIYSSDELRAVVKRLLVSGKRANDLLIVEFCDTRSDDGFYRKYTAFVVEDMVVPRFIAFSKNWVVKHKRAENAAHHKEDMDYLMSNPHRNEILDIFRFAGINYGRIDYGIKDGKIQTWEINVNPYITKKKSFYSENHLQGQLDFVRIMADTFASMEDKIVNTKHKPPVCKTGEFKRRYYIEKSKCEFRETLRYMVPKKLYGLIEYNRLVAGH